MEEEKDTFVRNKSIISNESPPFIKHSLFSNKQLDDAAGSGYFGFVNWCITNGILKSYDSCPYCGNSIRLRINRRNKTLPVTWGCMGRKAHTFSVTSGSIFSGLHYPLDMLIRLIIDLDILKPGTASARESYSILKDERHISLSACYNFRKKLLHLIRQYVIHHPVVWYEDNVGVIEFDEAFSSYNNRALTGKRLSNGKRVISYEKRSKIIFGLAKRTNENEPIKYHFEPIDDYNFTSIEPIIRKICGEPRRGLYFSVDGNPSYIEFKNSGYNMDIIAHSKPKKKERFERTIDPSDSTISNMIYIYDCEKYDIIRETKEEHTPINLTTLPIIRGFPYRNSDGILIHTKNIDHIWTIIKKDFLDNFGNWSYDDYDTLCSFITFILNGHSVFECLNIESSI